MAPMTVAAMMTNVGRVGEDLGVVRQVGADADGDHQWEGHILNEELLHPLGTSLDILRQDVGDVEDSNQDDHEGEGVNARSQGPDGC